MLRGATVERLSLTGRISWFPWQSTHRGASESPLAAALPCKERAYCSCSCVWQFPQLTFAGFPCGRLSTSRSEWQPVQPTLPWTEGENFLPSTNSETTFAPCFAVMPLSPWHARQVSLGSGPLAAQADAEGSSMAKATLNPGSTARRLKAGRPGRRRDGLAADSVGV